MRRLIAAAVLVFIIAGICIANSLTVKYAYEDLSEDIFILQNSFEESPEKAAELSAEFEEKWSKIEEPLSVFVNHDIIDNLGEAISRLPILAQKGEAMFLAECKSIEMELLHMKKDTRISLHSIF